MWLFKQERLQLIFEQEQDSNQKALTYEDELIDTRERLAMAVTIAEQYEYEISEYQVIITQNTFHLHIHCDIVSR